VFDLAWRGTKARTPGSDGGAGLGLAIVRGITEAHHGQVSVVNTDDGCRFEIRLPPLGLTGHARPDGGFAAIGLATAPPAELLVPGS
jgi:signal transduction histidine kinase